MLTSHVDTNISTQGHFVQSHDRPNWIRALSHDIWSTPEPSSMPQNHFRLHVIRGRGVRTLHPVFWANKRWNSHFVAWVVFLGCCCSSIWLAGRFWGLITDFLSQVSQSNYKLRLLNCVTAWRFESMWLNRCLKCATRRASKPRRTVFSFHFIFTYGFTILQVLRNFPN